MPSSCRRQTHKKYKGRPSPPFPAQECRGQAKTGNDGKSYVSQADSSGVYRWVTRKASGGKVYNTHDNGGRPFAVRVLRGRVEVTRQSYDKATDGYVPGAVVYRSPYKEIWLGQGPVGNTVLLQIGANRFAFIGERIYEFALQAGDAVVKYRSPVGNSDVPYPYIVGRDFTYLLLDSGEGPVYIPNDALDLGADAYGQYYGHIQSGSGLDVASAAKSIRIRQIAKRVF
jgi:hypothetical protein